jgi:hypothetical protein
MNPLVGDLSGKNTEDILKTMNDLYKKMNFASRTGNAAMLGQLKNILEVYKMEYEKRRQAEVKAAEENPIFKDSLDIG